MVTLWHVLEHLDDPVAALATIGSWLRPQGGLLVGVPNLASLQARLGGDRWFHLDVPRHRLHFTAPGLRALLGRQGFTVLGVRHLLLEHNPFGMWQTWLDRAHHPPVLRLQPAQAQRATALARPGHRCWHAFPLAPVAAWPSWRRGWPAGAAPSPFWPGGTGDATGYHLVHGRKWLRKLFGDPDDLQRRLGEFAEQMQGAQRLAWADNAIKLAVDLTVAAMNRINIQGTTEQQSEQLRAVMALVFPEAVTLVREAREGLQ